MPRLYLITLEVDPLLVGRTYNPLPSHLTFVHRFWSELTPAELAIATCPILGTAQPLGLTMEQTAILIEVEIQGENHLRHVCEKLALNSADSRRK